MKKSELVKNEDEKEEKKQKFNWQNLIFVLFFSIIGAVCGVLSVEYIDSIGSEELSFGEEMFRVLILPMLSIYIAMFLQTIIHEAGHLVFGKLTGYEFSSFRIASFTWIKENGKLKLKRYSLAGTAGQCLMSPPDMVDNKIPTLLYNLGGCIANIITSIIALILFFLLKDNFSIISVAMLIIAILGFAYALINGIPLKLGLIDNDGHNALILGKNPQAMRAFWIQMKINDLNSKGQRVKDMPEEWFAVPSEEEMNNSMTATLAVLACNRLMDQHSFDEAEAMLKHYLDSNISMVGIHKNMLICDYVFCQLIRNGNREDIEKLLDKQQKGFMKSMKKYPTIVRTEYAIALLMENDIAKSEQIREQFEKIAKSYPYISDIESERELMDIAQERYNEYNK